MDCFGYNKKDELVDTRAKYLIIAKLCFSTSLITAVFSIFALCYIGLTHDLKLVWIIPYILWAVVPLFANVVMIPLTIFSKYSLPCHKYSNDTDHVYHGVLHAQYQGFKTIWIVMLVAPFVLINALALFNISHDNILNSLLFRS